MAATKLRDEEIAEHMTHLPGWERRGAEIRREYRFETFGKAVDFVNAVARAAEDVQHHPDIDIRYSRVGLALSTHDAGGLTRLDMEMAASADSSADALGGS